MQVLRFMDPKRNIKGNYEKLKKTLTGFLEDDSNSRICAGKNDFVTRKKERKQKCILLDTLLNLQKSFIEKLSIKISYSVL